MHRRGITGCTLSLRWLLPHGTLRSDGSNGHGVCRGLPPWRDEATAALLGPFDVEVRLRGSTSTSSLQIMSTCRSLEVAALWARTWGRGLADAIVVDCIPATSGCSDVLKWVRNDSWDGGGTCCP